MRIEDHRRQIDILDRQIVELLNKRAECARQIGALKDASGSPAYAPAREEEVLSKVLEANRGPLDANGLTEIYREIVSACRALEKPLAIAYWGPPASNTHLAARQQFGSRPAYIAASTVTEVLACVERGQAEYGVVPVENSTEGAVNATLDTFLETSLTICAEIYVLISHHLLSRANTLDSVRKVYTMPQATAQCRGWLQQMLPGVELVDVTTTARAAELASAEADAAAIANRAAADAYGLRVLAERIEDNPRNRTRFLVLGHDEPPPSGKDKSTVVFSVPHEAGALSRALSVFDKHGVSLTMIQSRPTKLTPWEYVFYVDLIGHAGTLGDNCNLREALHDFSTQCLFVKLLGSYPDAA